MLNYVLELGFGKEKKAHSGVQTWGISYRKSVPEMWNRLKEQKGNTETVQI